MPPKENNGRKHPPQVRINVDLEKEDDDYLMEHWDEFGFKTTQVAKLGICLFIMNVEETGGIGKLGKLVVEYTDERGSNIEKVSKKISLTQYQFDYIEKLTKAFCCSFSDIIRYTLHNLIYLKKTGTVSNLELLHLSPNNLTNYQKEEGSENDSSNSESQKMQSDHRLR